MPIYDMDGNILNDPDLSRGRLQQETMTVHHEAVPGVEEQSHYEVIARYENGGMDVQKIIDVQEVQACDAYDETVTVLRYIPWTEEELAAMQAEREQPTPLDRIEAQLIYTAMMTDTLLEL